MIITTYVTACCKRRYYNTFPYNVFKSIPLVLYFLSTKVFFLIWVYWIFKRTFYVKIQMGISFQCDQVITILDNNFCMVNAST